RRFGGAARQKKGGKPTVAPLLTFSAETLPALAAVAASALAVAAAAAVVAALHRLGLVDNERAAVELRAVQSIDRALRLLARGHFDEAEAARLAGEFIGDQARGRDRAVRREDFLELSFGHRIRQPAYV